jgi:hypothetical protein
MEGDNPVHGFRHFVVERGSYGLRTHCFFRESGCLRMQPYLKRESKVLEIVKRETIKTSKIIFYTIFEVQFIFKLKK